MTSLQVLQVVQACLTCTKPTRRKEACLDLADLLKLPEKAKPDRCSPINKVFWTASVLHQVQMIQGTHALLVSLQAAFPQGPQGQV